MRGSSALVAPRLEQALGQPLDAPQRARLLRGHAGAEAARQDPGRARRQCAASMSRAGRSPIDDKAKALLGADAQRAARRASARRLPRPSGRRRRSKQLVRDFRRGARPEARRRRPAAARRADRLDRVAADLRGHGGAGPRRDAGAASRDAAPARLMTRRHCIAEFCGRSSYAATQQPACFIALRRLCCSARDLQRNDQQGCRRWTAMTPQRTRPTPRKPSR